MALKNKTVQKFISLLLIISMFTPALFMSFKPKKAEAFLGFGDIVFDPLHTAITIKIVAQEILKQFIMTVTRKLLDKMTQSTINWINSGFHGSPLFLENPESFFKDIGKSEIKTLIDMTGYDPNKFPFGKNFALNIIESYQNKFEDNAQYSLSKVINDPVLLEQYRNNFSVGGWNGFLINTQFPQNNYIGYQMLATEQLASKLKGTTQNAAQKVQTTLQQGMGFLSPQTCPTNPQYNNGKNEFQRPTYQPLPFKLPAAETELKITATSSGGTNRQEETEASKEARRLYAEEWQLRDASAKTKWAKVNTCPGGLKATTPGSVVGSQIGTSLGSKIHSAELGAAMGNSLSAIFDALINKFMQVGLNSLSSAINPPAEQTTNQNDFMYNGESINGVKSSVVPLSAIPNNYASGQNALGNCANTSDGGGDVPDKTQDECTALNGTWIANPIIINTGGAVTGGDNTYNVTYTAGTCTDPNGTVLSISEENCKNDSGTWTAGQPITGTNTSTTTPEIGMCIITIGSTTINPTTSQADCIASKGFWTPNP